MNRNILFTILFTVACTLCFSLIIYFNLDEYREVLTLNWKLSISNEYTELYRTSDDVSFRGDGIRYAVFEYQSIDTVNASFIWSKVKDAELEERILDICQDLTIPIEFTPDFKTEYLSYQIKKEDNSTLILLFEFSTNRLYIVEDLL